MSIGDEIMSLKMLVMLNQIELYLYWTLVSTGEVPMTQSNNAKAELCKSPNSEYRNDASHLILQIQRKCKTIRIVLSAGLAAAFEGRLVIAVGSFAGVAFAGLPQRGGAATRGHGAKRS